MKIICFGASTSTHSINKKFVTSVSKYYKEDEVEVLDLNDYPLPLFSVDLQNEIGIPEIAKKFSEKLDEADLLIISFAEHNGNYSTAYKNIVDWVSRIPNRKPYQYCNLFLLATSNGQRGGQSVLHIASERMPFDGGNVLATFSLPSFNKNFEEGKGVTDVVLRSQLEATVRKTKREMTKILNDNEEK